MKRKEAFVISLNMDLRLLIGLALVAAIVVLAYSSVGAQDGTYTTNDVQAGDGVEGAEESSDSLVLDCSAGLLPTTNYECVPAESLGSPGAEVAETGAVTASSGSTRKFYLTLQDYTTDTVLTACASGFHMAALYEILDVSNLTYDYENTAAQTTADSGLGPPSYWHGWVRTGQPSSGNSTAGTGNCQAWSSTASSDNGVAVRLSRSWEVAPGEIFAWDANSFTCAVAGPVWCMED